MNDQRYYSLDAMRGVAALSVALLHAGQLASYELASSAYLAVDLFFLLSGFVLARAYSTRLDGSLSAVEFFRLRLIRLYPLFILGVALGVIATIIGVVSGQVNMSSASIATSLLFSLFFLPSPASFPSGSLYPLNPPLWSLLFELVVNAFFGVFYRFLTTRVLIGVMIFSIILVAAAAIFFGSSQEGFRWITSPVGFFRAAFSFAFGVVLYRLRPSRTSNSSHVTSLLPIAALAVILWADFGRYQWMFDVTFIAVISPAMILFAYRHEMPSNWEKLATFIGISSVAVYTLHYPLIRVSQVATDALGWGSLTAMVCVIAALVALTPIIDARYDRPFRSRLTRFAAERRAKLETAQ